MKVIVAAGDAKSMTLDELRKFVGRCDMLGAAGSTRIGVRTRVSAHEHAPVVSIAVEVED